MLKTRRNFILKSGMLGANLMLNLPYVKGANFFNNGNNIKIGIIGLGSRGGGLVQTILKIPSFEIIACCDILEGRLKSVVERYSINVRNYSKYEKLLENNEIDAVIIATPLYLHQKMAYHALDSGKHVYCEKTMTYSSGGARSLIEKVSLHKTQIFQVGYQFRSSKLYSHVVGMVNNGYIGKIVNIQCQWNRNGDWRREVLDEKYEKLINWRMYRDFSRGLLGELSSHQIDFVNWLTNSHPNSVVGTGGIDYWKDGRETEDNVHVIFDYPNGIKASFSCLTANAFDGFQIKILGDRAAIVLTQNKAWIYPENHNIGYDQIDGVSGATVSSLDENGGISINIEDSEPTKAALIEFADNIKNHKEPTSNVDSAAWSTVAVEMASNAIITGKKVFWPDF